MDSIIVYLIIAASVIYLGGLLIKSVRQKKKGHCSGCGTE
jgi:hypothetical protein